MNQDAIKNIPHPIAGEMGGVQVLFVRNGEHVARTRAILRKDKSLPSAERTRLIQLGAELEARPQYLDRGKTVVV